MNALKRRFAAIAALLATVVLTGSPIAYAATTPSLGAAASYGVLSSTYTNTTAGTTINGDVGFTTGPVVVPGGVQLNFGSGAPYATAGSDQGSALANLNSQACTFTFAAGAIDLAADTTHGSIGVYGPGVYCVSGAASIGSGGITLNGAGTYIFRISGALTSVANSAVVLANGAAACDVFWTPSAAITLGANSTFVGTAIDTAGITVGSTVGWVGRALAFGGTVTTSLDTVTVPTCSAPATPTPTPAATPTPTPASSVTPTPSSSPVPTIVPGLPSSGVGEKTAGDSSVTMLTVLALTVILAWRALVRKQRKA